VTPRGALLLLVGLWLLPILWLLSTAVHQHLERRRVEAENRADTSYHAWTEADERAEALLRDLLDAREYRQLSRQGYLEVDSPGYEQRVYRIPRDGGLVRVFEHGIEVCDLCLRPAVPLPGKDVVALHKLMILGSEQAYLARANHFPCDPS
jgi:hypothetical protein